MIQKLSRGIFPLSQCMIEHKYLRLCIFVANVNQTGIKQYVDL